MKFSHRMAAVSAAFAIGMTCLLGSNDSQAGSAGGIPISRIDIFMGTAPTGGGAETMTGTNGIAVLSFPLNLNNNPQPGCVTAGNLDSMAFDTSTAQGKAWLALATSAFLAGRNVQIVGAGTNAVGISSCLQISTPFGVTMSGAPVAGGIEQMVQFEVL